MKKIIVSILIIFILVSGCFATEEDNSNSNNNKSSKWQLCLNLENIAYTKGIVGPLLELQLGEEIQKQYGNFSKHGFCIDFASDTIIDFSIKVFYNDFDHLICMYDDQSIINGQIIAKRENISVLLIPDLIENYTIKKDLMVDKDQYIINTNGKDGRLQFRIGIF